MAGETIEAWESRRAVVGGAQVLRALPRRERRTVGAWCFVDHALRDADPDVRGIGPHPHIGLQTVTWMLEGEILHRDSLGTEQLIRPGELNLMTAGHGIVHAEERINGRPVHLVQLWVAQPEATRDGAPSFEHHAQLPVVELEGGTATVLVGASGGASSAARRDTDHVGLDLLVRSKSTVPVEIGHEHAVIALDGNAQVEGHIVTPGSDLYLAPGRTDITITVTEPARLLVLGGSPFPERISMWWNYIARNQAEITAAHHAWTSRDGRFPIPASPLAPIDVGPPPWAPSR